MADCTTEENVRDSEIMETGGEEDRDSENDDGGGVQDGDSSSDDNMSSDDEKDEEKEKQITSLCKQISQNPYMYDLHTQRIKLLRDIGELDRLRQAREDMSKYFPLTEELWLDWVRDEIPLIDKDEDKKKIDDLFDKAFQDYMSVPVWLEYVQFSIGRMSEEDGVTLVREAFEKALTAVGLHVSQGSNIWEAYREFENAILAGLMPQAGVAVTKEQEEAFKLQNQRVQSMFKRQLVVPLLDMDMTLEEFNEWQGGDALDSNLQAAYDKAKAKLESIQDYEDQLLTTPAPHLEVYQEYIKHELSSNDPPRIQCLFERALKENCLVPDLWIQYTKYLDKLKMKTLIMPAYERAVRNCPWSSQIWTNYMLAQERQGTDFDAMKGLVDKALGVGFSQSSDYLNVWLQYCDYLRRRINWDGDHKEELETFRLTADKAVEFMFDNFGAEGDPEGSLNQFWAFIEAKYCHDIEKAREIWSQVMQAGHGAEAVLWLQYYRLERSYGDNKHCRRILQKALNSVTDWPESIVQAYINFEREEGDLEQYDTAVSKCEAQMERISERKAKAAEKEAAQQEGKKKDKKSLKRNTNQSESSQQPQAHATSKGAGGGGGENKSKRKFEADKKDGDGFAKPKPPTRADEPQQKKAKTELSAEEGPHLEKVQHDPSKDNITVFVSNLDFNLEIDRLRQIFQKCGEITDIRLVRNYKGKSKGFGYVEFADGNSVLQALKLDREPVDGRPMFVSRCEDRSTGKSSHQFKYSTDLEKSKLFIKGLPFSMTKDELHDLFKEHGRIKEVRIVTYRSGSSKGIAYVEYDNEASAKQAVIQKDGHTIDTFVISVSISNPPERKTPLTTRMDAPGRGMSLGSGKKETEFRGKARTQVSLLPRSVRNQPSASSSSSSSSSSVSEKKSDDNKSNSSNGSAMSNDDFRKMLLK